MCNCFYFFCEQLCWPFYDNEFDSESDPDGYKTCNPLCRSDTMDDIAELTDDDGFDHDIESVWQDRERRLMREHLRQHPMQVLDGIAAACTTDETTKRSCTRPWCSAGDKDSKPQQHQEKRSASSSNVGPVVDRAPVRLKDGAVNMQLEKFYKEIDLKDEVQRSRTLSKAARKRQKKRSKRYAETDV